MHDAAGASALARAILEQWAEESLASQTQISIARAAAYVGSRPAGWGDDPADFFPSVTPPSGMP